jgi:GAF domain-containing protein
MKGPGSRLTQVRVLVEDESRADDDKPAAVGRMQRLCRAAARALPATGVGISLIAETGTQVTVAASGETTEQIEELQFALGEGPCLDAYATRRPVLNSDLLAAGGRWPGYVRAVQEHGVRAVFAFPLQVGAARMGAMDVYRDEAGGLSQEALAQAFTFAEVATSDLLDSQVEPGDADEILRDAVDNRYELFQAQGMAMVQLRVSLAEAMIRIRAHAYAQDQRLTDVASDIVAGRLVLEADEP